MILDWFSDHVPAEVLYKATVVIIYATIAGSFLLGAYLIIKIS